MSRQCPARWPRPPDRSGALARGYMARHAAVIAVASISLASGLACGAEQAADPPARPAADQRSEAGERVYESEHRGFRATIPAGWRRATSRLSPKLADPREIFSAATFRPAYRPTDCEAFAGSAQEDMGRRDAFVSVQERGRPTAREGYPRGEFEDVTTRPRPLRADDLRRARSAECASGTARLFMLTFEDAGRVFHVLIGIGASAPRGVRADALRLVDSLEFDPSVKPDWRATS
jgi:hypothetical protein